MSARIDALRALDRAYRRGDVGSYYPLAKEAIASLPALLAVADAARTVLDDQCGHIEPGDLNEPWATLAGALAAVEGAEGGET